MTYVDIIKQSPVILSLCPGIRGLERGLQRVFPIVRVAAYVEIETFIVENLLSAMETGLVDAAPIWTNLKTFNPDPFRGKIDILLGGYPCQPFSLAGNRGGADDPRHLYPYIESAISTIRPAICFFENVSGHLSMGFQQVRESLRNMGYRVEAGIYTAEEVGATHERERLFILAILEDAISDRSWRINKGGFQSQSVGTSEKLGNTGHESMEGGCIGIGIAEEGRKESIRSAGEPSGSPAVGHSESLNKRNERNESRKSEGTNRGSGNPELADSNCKSRRLSDTTGWINNIEVERGSKEMANPNNDGSNESENRQSHPSRNDVYPAGSDKFLKSERFSSTGNHDRFPAGQGAFQYEWEEPRTIESSVEYTINGYNFTEDLHRAIGNSVVEQTAELAFRDLWNKHFPYRII